MGKAFAGVGKRVGHVLMPALLQVLLVHMHLIGTCAHKKTSCVSPKIFVPLLQRFKQIIFRHRCHNRSDLVEMSLNPHLVVQNWESITVA